MTVSKPIFTAECRADRIILILAESLIKGAFISPIRAMFQDISVNKNSEMRIGDIMMHDIIKENVLKDVYK